MIVNWYHSVEIYAEIMHLIFNWNAIWIKLKNTLNYFLHQVDQVYENPVMQLLPLGTFWKTYERSLDWYQSNYKL